MGFLPKDLARITCEMLGITLWALRTNKVTLGCFCATLKDSGTLYERIAGAVNERERGKPIQEPNVTPKEVEALCKRFRGSSAAKAFAEKLAERAHEIQERERTEASAVASAAAAKGNATKRRKKRSGEG